jgi:hypothetical protein
VKLRDGLGLGGVFGRHINIHCEFIPLSLPLSQAHLRVGELWLPWSFEEMATKRRTRVC